MADLKQIKELNEEKRKSARRKEFIMAELLETERSYVKVNQQMIVNDFVNVHSLLSFSISHPLL